MQRRAPARNQHWAESVTRRQRVLNIATWIAAVVTLFFGIMQIVTGPKILALGLVNVGTAIAFMLIPLLHRFGDVIASLTFVTVAFASLTYVGWHIGTDSGLQFYYIVSASLAVLVLGVEHLVMASVVVAIGAGLTIASQFVVPGDTGIQPRWAVEFGFVLTTISACVMIFATVYYAMREVSRAEAAMEVEYGRSEALLANILPATIAARLKRSGARRDRRPVRGRVDPVRRHRRLHRTGQPHAAGGTSPLPRPPLYDLRPAGGQARPGEDQDHRRLLHGGQRRSPAAG